MIYLIERNGHFYFNRRVPEAYREHDKRSFIRHALKTRDKKIALRLAIAQNDKLEAYWATLLGGRQEHSQDQYKSLVERASLLGFSYHPNQNLAHLPIQEIIRRLQHVEKENYNERHVEALLGKMPEPEIFLDQAINLYFETAKDKLLNKAPYQIRKWKEIREKSMRNFTKCVGNKPISALSRADALRFRDYWIERIKKENLSTDSANKEMINVKTIVSSVADNFKIELDSEHIFKKLLLKNEEYKTRLPFDTSFIRCVLLNHENLSGLNEQARWALYAFAETGAGFNELTGLLAEDIVLNATIPHIQIRARRGHTLKTKFRKRTIPLVGHALDAFKACPNGFTRYHERPDSLSGMMSKYLRENNILPSKQHSIYSLRHSFQDRLLAVNTPDRVQADLMGHKFHRPLYGDGATLAHKLEWMTKIQLKEELSNTEVCASESLS